MFKMETSVGPLTPRRRRGWNFLSLSLLTACTAALASSDKAEVKTVEQSGTVRRVRTLLTNWTTVHLARLAEEEKLSPLPFYEPKESPFMPILGPRPVPDDALLVPPQGEEEFEISATHIPPPPPAADFLALGDDNTRIPPDTHGAVGPLHLMATLNSQIAIQDRDGQAILTQSLFGFWNNILPAFFLFDVFDPRVLYDPFCNRWYHVAVANRSSGSSSVLLAVSQTNDPTGFWNANIVDADANDGTWADYPSVGFNRDWIVIQVNMFDICGELNCFDTLDNDGDGQTDANDLCGENNCTDGVDNNGDLRIDEGVNSFRRSQIHVFDKQAICAGSPFVNVTTFSLPITLGGVQAAAVDYDDTPGIIHLWQTWTGNNGGGFGFWRLYTITGTVGAEVFTPGSFFGVMSPWSGTPPDNNADGIPDDFAPQLGSAQRVNTGDDRMQCVVQRNNSIWFVHNVFLPTGGNPTRSAIQWIEYSIPNVTFTQRGQIDDPTATIFRAFPSIAVNQNNDVLFGYTSFSAAQFAAASYSYRAGTDAGNTLRTESTFKAGEASYFKQDGIGRNRWGDFSMACVDPYNDIDLWTIQEYAALPSGGVDRWGTWWGRFGGECAPPRVWAKAATTGPSYAGGFATAYDSRRGVTVLFGGGVLPNGTWEWTGSTWIPRNPVSAPANRAGPGLAYDSGRGVTVMFGGFNAPTDTWEWNGMTWTQAHNGVSGAPPYRRMHGMAYDSGRSVTVLFGGLADEMMLTTHNDTWEWNGTNWTLRTPAAMPSSRRSFAMAYDALRGVTVLHGGWTSSGAANDTWEWNGTNWTQLTPVNSPGARYGHEMVFDATRGVAVLYGGSGPSGIPQGTWEFDGTNWVQGADSGAGGQPDPAMVYDLARRQTVLIGDLCTNCNPSMNNYQVATWVYPVQSTTGSYKLTGNSTGTGWSWCITAQGTTVCNLNTPGVNAGSPPSALAAQFVNSINGVGCQGVSAGVVATAPNTFQVSVGGSLAFSLCVGPAGAQPTCCLPGPPCTFNPSMDQIDLVGTDCDGNLTDDAIDLAAGTLDDEDGNGIPDVCECVPGLYGDVNGTGVIDVDDILYVLDGFADPPSYPASDLEPCAGDGDVDVDDILAMLDAFSGMPACPDGCQ